MRRCRSASAYARKGRRGGTVVPRQEGAHASRWALPRPSCMPAVCSWVAPCAALLNALSRAGTSARLTAAAPPMLHCRCRWRHCRPRCQAGPASAQLAPSSDAAGAGQRRPARKQLRRLLYEGCCKGRGNVATTSRLARRSSSSSAWISTSSCRRSMNSAATYCRSISARPSPSRVPLSEASTRTGSAIPGAGGGSQAGAARAPVGTRWRGQGSAKPSSPAAAACGAPHAAGRRRRTCALPPQPAAAPAHLLQQAVAHIGGGDGLLQARSLGGREVHVLLDAVVFRQRVVVAVQPRQLDPLIHCLPQASGRELIAPARRQALVLHLEWKHDRRWTSLCHDLCINAVIFTTQKTGDAGPTPGRSKTRAGGTVLRLGRQRSARKGPPAELAVCLRCRGSWCAT